MRARALVAVVVAAGLLGFLAAGGGPRADPPPPAPTSTTVTETPRPRDSPATPSRNPFVYADETVPAPMPPLAPSPRTSVESVPPAPAPVRLVGLVYEGGRLKAALAIAGAVHVLAPGEEAAGYLLLSLDDEQGARLRGPGGNELVVQQPER